MTHVERKQGGLSLLPHVLAESHILGSSFPRVLILINYRDGDACVRSFWLYSRNDAIGDVAVMLAALGWSRPAVGRTSVWWRSSRHCS